MPRILPPLPKNARLEPSPDRKRWSRCECQMLCQRGLLLGHYELIDGQILVEVRQKPLHRSTAILINERFRQLFGRLYVQVHGPIDVSDADREFNQPEPDVAILASPITTFARRQPGPADLLLVIEASDGTLRFDMRNKAALFARAGIMEYWVVDIAGRRLIAHRQPGAEGYAEILEYAESETIALRVYPEGSVRVSDLLPPA